jgi:hypothetical protein
METWDLWYPRGGAQGLPFARGRIERQDIVWVHAAPDRLRVEVRNEDGTRIAFGERLDRTGPYVAMTKLERAGARIARTDEWPQPEDIGRVVILPGGEAGVLTSWWNSDARDEWRWTVEFYNKLAR